MQYLFTWAALAQVPVDPHNEAKYWIVFKDKSDSGVEAGVWPVSSLTLQNRRLLHLPPSQFTDLPVSQSYLTQLRVIGVEPQCTSRWLNAVSA